MNLLCIFDENRQFLLEYTKRVLSDLLDKSSVFDFDRCLLKVTVVNAFNSLSVFQE